MSSYTVRRGDTLWSIANRNHTTVANLLKMNPALNTARYNYGNLIFAGTSVNLAASASTPTSRAPAKANVPANLAPTPQKSIEQQLLDQLNGLPGQERDAYAALKTLFDSYGLGTLAPKILTYLQSGFGGDTITVLLQQTDEYKKRFVGNDARKAAGLAVLTPAEYLSTEAAYRQVIQAGGLDPHFNQSFGEWIGKDISPSEIQNRVNLAVQATTQAPPQLTQAFGMLGFNAGDLASYFLNDQNATPKLQMKLNQAQIMAAGLQSGIKTDAATSEQFAQNGVTYQQAQTGYAHVAEVLPEADKLSKVYSQQTPYTQNMAEMEFVAGNGTATVARENLAAQEKATFSGQGGVGDKSFKQNTSAS